MMTKDYSIMRYTNQIMTIIFSLFRIYEFREEVIFIFQVTAVEVDGESQTVERARVSPSANSHIFVQLKPDTQYDIGVVAFVDHEPKLVYKLPTTTSEVAGVAWKEKPTITQENAEQFMVQWRKPVLPNQTISKFVVEYRLPNETKLVYLC